MANQRPSIDSIFFAALEKETPEQMNAYLDEACGNDKEFRARAEKLLNAHCKAAASFMETPPSALDQVLDVNHDALEAGLAATFGPDASVVVGSAGHSVLKSLSKSIPNVPQITLADSRQDQDSVVQPRSDEVPKSDADDRYQLLGEIARGGMGAIIKGRDTDLGRDLAVKVLLDSHKKKPELIQRFVEEAQIGGQLQHPGIVPVYELGQFEDQRPFFTMKLVKGQTLASILGNRRSPQEDMPHLLGIFEQVCQAMGYAHSKGVIHRDLKPANIMVGAFGEVQVMDWGLSKVLKAGGVADERKSIDKHRDVSVVETRRSAGSDVPGSSGSNTMDGSVMGTPAYMPPEQAHGEIDRLDQRADVFGLGAILAEILTGKPPYVADSGSDLLRLARRGQLEDCNERLDASGAEADLIALCKTALSSEPSERFKDAEQLSDEVTRYLEGVQERLKQTELARIEAQTRSEEERRRKKLYLAIAGMLAAGLIAAAFVGWSLKQKNDHIQAQTSEIEKQNDELSERYDEIETASAIIRNKNLELATKNAEIEVERDEAMLQVSRANIMRLAAEAQNLRSASTPLSLLVSAEAADRSRGLGVDIERVAHAALLESSSLVCGTPLGEDYSGSVWRSRNRPQFSADGRWMVVSNALFDLHSQKHWSSPIQLHDDWVHSVAIDDSSRWLANGGTRTGEDRGLIHLFDLHKKIDGPSRTIFEEVKSGEAIESVYTLAISPNGRWLATEAGKSVQLWDLENSSVSTPFQTIEQSERVTRLRFPQSLPDCVAISCLNTSTAVATTAIWKFEEPQFQRFRELPGGRTTFSPNGEWLATATVDEVYVWKIKDGEISEDPQIIDARLGVHDKPPAFTPDGDRLVTMTKLEGGKIWSLRKPDAAPVLLSDLGGEAASIFVSPNGRWLVAGMGTGLLAWDLNSTDASLQPLQITTDEIGGAIDPDSRWLIVGRRRWNLRDLQAVRSPTSIVTRASMHLTGFSDAGSELNTLQPDPNSQPFFQRFTFSPVETKTSLEFSLGEGTSCASMSDNKQWLVVGKQDGSVDLYDLQGSSLVAPVSLQLEHTDAICQLQISDEDSQAGQILLTASKDRTVRVSRLDPVTHSLTSSVEIAHDHDNFVEPKGLSPASISPDKRWLVVKKPEGHPDGATLFRLGDDEFKSVDSFTIPADKMFWDVMFSPDGRWALTRANKPVGDWLWDLEAEDPSEDPIQLKGRTAGSFHTAAAFSRDSSLLAIGEWVGRASLWNLKAADPSASHRQLTAGSHVESVAFSPDNKWLATGSRDGSIRLWCMEDEDPTVNPMILVGHTKQVYLLDFHPTLPILVSHSDASEIRLWNYDLESAIQDARRLAGRNLRPIERDQLGLTTK